MTKDELLKILLMPCSDSFDSEEGDDPSDHHEKCDAALLEYINDKDVTEAYRSRTKWFT